MKEHDDLKTLSFFFLHTSSDHSMIPDSHLFQKRVIFSLETPLSLPMDTRKPLEKQLGPDICNVAKPLNPSLHNSPKTRQKQRNYLLGHSAGSGIALETPDPKYLLLDVQAEKAETLYHKLIMQDSESGKCTPGIFQQLKAAGL